MKESNATGTRTVQSLGSKALSEDIKRDRGVRKTTPNVRGLTDTSDTAEVSVVSSTFKNKATHRILN